MKNIYDIYEANYPLKNIYQGILGDLDDVLAAGDMEVDRISRTFKEKLILIVTLAGELNEKESKTFRSIIDDAIEAEHTSMGYCYMDNKLKANLIVCSNKVLTNADFKGFPLNKKEYDFHCSAVHIAFDQYFGDHGVKTACDKALANKGKFIYSDRVSYNKDTRAIALGNTIILQHGGMFFIKVKNLFRLIPTITNSGRGVYKIDWNQAV